MQQVGYIVREPLLNAKQKVLGYRFKWQDDAANDALSLAQTIAGGLHDAQNNWLFADQLIFLKASPALLASEALRHLPPANTVLRLTGAALTQPGIVEQATALRKDGYGISLTDGFAAVQDKSLLGLASHIEIRFAATEVAALAKLYGLVKQRATRIIAKDIASWEDYDACAALGVDTLVGKLHLTPRENNRPKGLNAEQATILQLMQMVQANADVWQLELVLKRNPTMAYQLFRHINTAGIGQRAEVHSLRHAVALLGYDPLYRWLCLLLASASTPGYSPVLMHTALVRGHLAELLGAATLTVRESESLFVAGMFSLLDRLTGMPMDALIDKIGLADNVKQAIVSRQGRLGDYLALAEACEVNGSLAASLAKALRIAPHSVNKRHLTALAWANKVMST